jgi:hypothetical protein
MKLELFRGHGLDSASVHEKDLCVLSLYLNLVVVMSEAYHKTRDNLASVSWVRVLLLLAMRFPFHIKLTAINVCTSGLSQLLLHTLSDQLLTMPAL